MARHYRDEEAGPPGEAPPLTDTESETDVDDPNLQIDASPTSSHNGDLPIPMWMRESAKNFKYKWVPLPLRKAGRWIATWVKGPDPPQRLYIQPWCPSVQEAPLKLMDRFAPKQRHRIFLLFFVYCIWFLTWALMIRHNRTGGYIAGYGKPSPLWCGASFWNDGNGCGLNGNNCRPFAAVNMAFNCPAQCKSDKVFDTYYIGNQSINYHGLVIGGPNPTDPTSRPVYRGDSFICQAAIHAGVITDGEGGCGVAKLIGSHEKFYSSNQHGIESNEFPATFPRSFTFETLTKSQAKCPKDSRWPIFAVTAVALVLISIFTTSPAALFWSSFVILILHVGIVSDPPNDPTVLDLVSKFLSRFLPACFVAWIFYRYCAIPLLKDLTAQFEKTILFLGFAFIGALNNYTFAPLIPIERLTPHDVKSQPGAPIALATIIILILTIVVTQIHFIRVSGLLPRYLKIYALISLALIIILSIPGLRLRIHHYILAIIFMPGTAMQIRPTLIYQGLLLGLFVNGIARWGFDSIAQTPAALGERGGSGSPDDNSSPGAWWGAHSPNVSATVSEDLNRITFNWTKLPHEQKGVDGVSILINDVERWRGYLDEELYLDSSGVTLDRRPPRNINIDENAEDTLLQPSQQHDHQPFDNSLDIIANRPTAPPNWFRKSHISSSDRVTDLATTDNHEAYEYQYQPQFYRFAWMKGGETGLYGGVGTWDEDGVWWPERSPRSDRDRDRDRDGDGGGKGRGNGTLPSPPSSSSSSSSPSSSSPSSSSAFRPAKKMRVEPLAKG